MHDRSKSRKRENSRRQKDLNIQKLNDLWLRRKIVGYLT